MIDENWHKPKTPRQLIEHHAEVAAVHPMMSAPFRGAGGTSSDYVRRGLEIPERLLPGRYIQNLSAEDRESLKKLKPEDTWMGGMWYCTRYGIQPEPRTLSEHVAACVPKRS